MRQLLKILQLILFAGILSFSLPAIAASPRQICHQALLNSDFSTSQYETNLNIKNPLGNFSLHDNIFLQKNPFYLYHDLTIQLKATGKQDKQPKLIKIQQYIHTQNQAFSVYSNLGTNAQNNQHWTHTDMKMPTDWYKEWQKSLSSMNNYENVQKFMQAMTTSEITHQDTKTTTIKVFISAKELFSTYNFLQSPLLLSGLPEHLQQKNFALLWQASLLLQKSAPIIGYITVDNNTKQVCELRFNITPQVKSILKFLLIDHKQSPVIAKEKASIQVLSLDKKLIDKSLWQSIIEKSTAELTIKMHPLYNVSPLITPNAVVQKAKPLPATTLSTTL